ncbi:formylglycine-generating enzyme family protein, partial [Chitinophaga sp.]|uniref:formylglycine-generating enzyme family protein n=1 Tax=Chitinophaga sp. TaxID=1869181 RepID=UPI002F91E0FE
MIIKSRVLSLGLLLLACNQPPAKNVADNVGKAACCAVPSRFAAKGAEGSDKEPENMIWLSGGEFMMGTDEKEAYEAEKPAHRVKVDGFWIDKTEVTNEEFKAFVDATGYITVAERKPLWEDIRK